MTLDEAKHQCGLAEGVSYFDQDLLRLIAAARESVEYDTGLVVWTGEHKVKFTEWPHGDAFELPVRPVTAVTSITYVATDGDTDTWTSTNYVLETFTVIPTIRLAYSKDWPSIRGDTNGITVTFTAGYADRASIPARVKQATLLLVNHWFVNRDTVSIGTISPEIAETYNALIARLMRPSYP